MDCVCAFLYCYLTKGESWLAVTFIKGQLWVKHCAKYLKYINSFYRWEN